MIRIHIKFITFFLFLPFLLLGQIKIHKHLTTSDGLINDIITTITQDQEGYIWIGTENGASRWDGNNFFNLQKHNGLTTSNVSDIKIAEDSSVYIATFGGGIITYKASQFDTLNESDGLSTNWINKIFVKENGEILFGGIEGNITVYINGNFSQLLNPEVLKHKTISSFYESDDGTLYIGLFQGGFYTYKNSNLTHYGAKDGMQNEDVNCFEEDSHGTIFFGTNLGIHEFKNGEIKYLNDEWELKFTAVKQIGIINESIYFPSDLGLVEFNSGKTQIVGIDNGLSFNEISSFWIDQFGIFYLGTHGNGVDIYDPGKIENFNTKNGLPDNKVWSITEDNDGNLFFGTQKGLMTSKGEQQNTITLSNIYYANVAKSVIHVKNNTTYVGTTYGLNILENGKNKKLTKEDGLIDTYIMDMAETKSGDILLGTRFGVVKYTGNGISNITQKDGLIDNYVQSILVAQDSTIYFGTNGRGITYFKDGIFSHIKKQDGLTDENIHSFAQSDDGTIYIGTYDGGLNILKDSLITSLDIDDGLSSNTILAIAPADSSIIYLSTFNGLNIVDLSGKQPKISIINSLDGLASDRCLDKALYIDKNENVWIGTSKGLTKYNPKSKRINKIPPKIYLTGFEIFNEKQNLQNLLNNPSFNYDQNYLKFTYTGINLSAPNKILYRYRLSNIDDHWIESKENYVQYTNLDDGNYQFKVSAQNEEGIWSNPVVASFSIIPAWWETWWFYSIVVLTLGALIAFLASYRLKHSLAIERIRTKISADLHDSIGSGLSEITILSELLNAQPNAQINDLQSGLKNISVTARSLVGNMSDIVWLVNPSKDSLKDLLLRLQDSYHEVLAQLNISFKINKIENLDYIHLSMIFRQHLFLIFKEAINNSLKYSECKNIRIDFEIISKQLVITYNDDGKGFDIEKIKKGNGLRNMKERAKTINAKLEYKSHINEGTSIIFTGNFKRLK